MKGVKKEGVVSQGKVENIEVTNEGDEGYTSNDIVNNTSPTTMGPTGKTTRIREVGEHINNHKRGGLVELKEVLTIPY